MANHLSSIFAKLNLKRYYSIIEKKIYFSCIMFKILKNVIVQKKNQINPYIYSQKCTIILKL